MKRSNKKGFTIVELVIVIAVIAILAAVLIPTIAGLVRKANISSDTVVAKNLNTALAMADGEIADFDAALAAIKSAGYIVPNLNAKADECYFVWDQESKQIILVDGKDDYSVIYSNKEYSQDKENWFIAVSDGTLAATIEAANPGATIVYTPESKKDLLTAFTNLSNKSGKQSVYIGEDINLSKSGEIFKLDNANADVTVDFSGATVNCAGAIDINDYEYGTADRAFTVENAQSLTVSNGTLNAGDTYGTVAVDSATTVNVKNMTLINSYANGLNLKTRIAGAVIDIKDTVIEATTGGGAEAAYGTINFTNVTIDQKGAVYDHCSTCIAVSYGGVANVYSGKYSSENGYILSIFSSGGTINVYGGSFEVDGTFKDFDEMTRTDWEAIFTATGCASFTIDDSDPKKVVFTGVGV